MKNNQLAVTPWRKLLRILLYTFGALLLLVVLAATALTLPVVQQRITREAESFLQNKLGTRVEIGAIRLQFPYHLSLEKLLLEDEQGDTLAHVGQLTVTVDMWQLLHQTIEIQKVTLEDASVYLHQKDSIYNFDFIVQAFASPKSTAPVVADTTASPWKLQLDLTVLELRKVNFLLQDDDSESITQANIGSLETVLAKADLKTLYFELDGLALADSDIRLIEKKQSLNNGKPSPSFGLLLHNGDITNSHVLYSTPERSLEANLAKTTLAQLRLQSANNVIAIQTQGVRVDNSAVAYRDPLTALTPGHFNAGDLDLTALNAEIPSFFFQNDTIFVQANALSGRDKSGLQVHSLRTLARVTPGSIEIKDAVATLNQTTLDGDVVLFKNTEATFDRMQVQLRQVKGVIGDLILLMPPLENQALSRLRNMHYEVSGKLSGWLENLQTENIRFRAGSGTVAYFNGSVQQLTDPSKLGMNLNITRLETNRADLVQWMSVGDTPMDSLLAQPLPAFLSVSGVVNGNMSRLQLTLGGEVSALQTGNTFPPVSDIPLQFDLTGSLTDVNDPARLGMDLQVNGLDAPLNFFAFLEPRGLRFPDMLQTTGTLKGTLAALQTNLQFKALRGENTSTLAFKGLLQNLRTPERLGFDVAFDASLARQEILGYVPEDVVSRTLRLPAVVQVNGQAKGTVKDAAAQARIGLGGLGQIQLDGTLRDTAYQVALVAQNLQVSQLAVDSALLSIKTVGLTAKINGEGFQFGETARFDLKGNVDSLIWDNLILRDITLDAAVNGRRFSGGFTSTDPRAAVVVRAKGDFSTAIPLLETDITLNCLDMRAFGWLNRPTTVCMHILSKSEGMSLDTLTAKLTIEKIDLQYDTVHIYPGDLSLDVKLDKHQNNIRLVSDWLTGEIKGFFALQDLSETIAGIAEQYIVVDRSGYLPRVGTDSLFIELQFLKPEILTTGLIPGLTKLDPLYLKGSLIGQRNYFDLLIQAPRIVYLGWDVDSLNVRSFAGDTAAMFVVTTPLVKRGGQDFIENAVLNGRFQANVADVSFKASDDAGRERFLLELEAILNKKTKETRVTLSPRQVIDFKTWTVDADNRISITPGGIAVEKFILTGDGQSISVEGATRKLSGNKTGLDFAVDIDRLNYNNFDIFIAGVLRDLGGWADAHLKIGGSTDAMQVRGTMQLHETYFTPTFTNVRYQLSETPLEFTEAGVNLDGLTLRDPYGKTLEVKGNLSTADWKNIQTNLTLHADRWQVLNATKQQNPVYFGELYVSLDGTIRGPVSQPDIQLVVKTAKESNFTYVYDAATQVLQHEGVVFFLPPPRQYVRPPVYDAPANKQLYTLSASIEIDSNLTISSVINPVTGDDFRGKATGKLQFDQLLNGNMTLSGRVELVRGVYNYSYQSVVKRSFDVTAGSTITWTGDIRSPELDLKARYKFKASPYPLVVNQLSSASAEEAAAYRKPQTFFLQTTLSGSVTQPDVNFQFIYPSTEQTSLGSSFGSQQSSLVQSAVGNVNQDKNLLSRQVFGVLLLRNFIGDPSGVSGSISGGNPLQSGLSSFLTGQINALADQYLTFIDVDFATTEGATNNGASQAEGTTNYQLRLQKSFFEDRLTFKISGGTSVGGSGSDDVQSALENASVEYALTPKGEIKVTVFSERGFELLNASSANLRNSGAGLILTKEFGGKKKR
jgi:hypothetical protein